MCRFYFCRVTLHVGTSALIRRCYDWPTTITHVPVAAVLVLNTPDDGRLLSKHVEWPCRNKTCTVLHQVGVSFDLSVTFLRRDNTSLVCTNRWKLTVWLCNCIASEEGHSSSRGSYLTDMKLRVCYVMGEKVKLKWSRYRPGVDQRVGRGIALLFHDRGSRRGWVVSSTPRPHITPRKEPVPILHEVGWAPGAVWTGGKSRPHKDTMWYVGEY